MPVDQFMELSQSGPIPLSVLFFVTTVGLVLAVIAGFGALLMAYRRGDDDNRVVSGLLRQIEKISNTLDRVSEANQAVMYELVANQNITIEGIEDIRHQQQEDKKIILQIGDGVDRLEKEVVSSRVAQREADSELRDLLLALGDAVQEVSSHNRQKFERVERMIRLRHRWSRRQNQVIIQSLADIRSNTGAVDGLTARITSMLDTLQNRDENIIRFSQQSKNDK